MSLETDIIETQNMLNSKQARIGSLVIDNLTVNNPIDINKLNVENFEVANLTVTGKLTVNDIEVTGDATFNNNVVINGGITVAGDSNFSGSITSPEITVGELRDVTIKGWLKVETNITAGGEVRGSKVWNAVWN